MDDISARLCNSSLSTDRGIETRGHELPLNVPMSWNAHRLGVGAQGLFQDHAPANRAALRRRGVAADSVRYCYK